MPYQTPFDKMNENYKNRTGSFATRPSAPPSKIDKQIEAAAARFMERIQQQVNPVNNMREVDRRSAQVAAQDKSFLGARTDFSPTPGYTPEKGAFSVPKGTFTSPRGTFAFGGPDGAGVAPPKGTFAFGGPDGAGVAPPKGTFGPADYSPGNYSPTTDYSPTPINKGISTAAQKAIKPLENLQQAGRDMREFGKGVTSDVGKLADWPGRINTGPKEGPVPTVNLPTGQLKGPPKAIKEGVSWFGREMGAGFGKIASDLKQDFGGTAEAGPYRQPASDMRTGPNQRPGTETPYRTGPRGTITSPGAVDDKTTTRTPTDQGEQVGTQKAGTTFNGSTAPATGNRYAEMIAAGPEAQAKFIKDANLIHMIRGTNQSYANADIAQQPDKDGRGGLGLREFKTALEAAAGIDAQTALSQDAAAKERATELEKQKIANLKGRFQPVTKTNTITGQQETHMVDTLLNEDIGGDDEIQEVEAAADAWKASDQGEEAQAALKAAIKRFAKQRKYLQYLTSSAATSK